METRFAKGGSGSLNLEDDRTELNDLAEKYPQRVTRMKKEWFNLAKNKDRLKEKALKPVKPELKSLSFRKDTSDQLVD